jgi:hypothetical protein
MAIAARILAGSGALFLFIGVVPLAGAQTEPSISPESARVRASDAKLSALIAEAGRRSPTFRTLVASIEATDGIVFVEAGGCRRGVAACLTWHVTLAGAHRLLFVRVDSDKSDVDLIASVGHELQHALEVLAEPSLRSTSEIHLFYTGGWGRDLLRAVETPAARTVGDTVFREVRRSRSQDAR